MQIKLHFDVILRMNIYVHIKESILVSLMIKKFTKDNLKMIMRFQYNLPNRDLYSSKIEPVNLLVLFFYHH